MLIYIHVPFCKSKCHYCAFNSWVPESGETQAYLSGVLAEIELWPGRIGKKEVSTIFVGGGTPSTLPAAAIGRCWIGGRLFPAAPAWKLRLRRTRKAGVKSATIMIF
jgi:Coproporphyrinogen III oxidase and related Fe-S oxidoreductases